MSTYSIIIVDDDMLVVEILVVQRTTFLQVLIDSIVTAEISEEQHQNLF